MFMPPSAPRSRPLFAVSLAAHAALLAALAVPPLLATPEPPEPEVRMVPFAVGSSRRCVRPTDTVPPLPRSSVRRTFWSNNIAISPRSSVGGPCRG